MIEIEKNDWMAEHVKPSVIEQNREEEREYLKDELERKDCSIMFLQQEVSRLENERDCAFDREKNVKETMKRRLFNARLWLGIIFAIDMAWVIERFLFH